jgi:hypothetical protein
MKKQKRTIISVKPITSKSNQLFEDKMNKLHGCYVNFSDSTKMNVTSINKQYHFSINLPKDSNWEIVESY